MIKRKSTLKRIAALMLGSVMLIFSCIPAFAEEVKDCCEGLTPGDANGDGKVTVQDSVTVLRYSAQ